MKHLLNQIKISQMDRLADYYLSSSTSSPAIKILSVNVLLKPMKSTDMKNTGPLKMAIPDVNLW